jgi:hypothetical protein
MPVYTHTHAKNSLAQFNGISVSQLKCLQTVFQIANPTLEDLQHGTSCAPKPEGC